MLDNDHSGYRQDKGWPDTTVIHTIKVRATGGHNGSGGVRL